MTIDEPLAPVRENGASGAGVGAPIWSAATLPWRLAEVGGAGALAGVLMILLWLDPRPDLPVAAAQAFFWIKAAYPVVVAACALVAATRSARGQGGALLALGVASAFAGAMLLSGGVQALGLTWDALATLFWPNAAVCLGNILVIATPMLALAVAGLRDVELERPALTGLSVGLFCGGVAATVDGLHCWQTTYAFVGPWFSLAMLISGAIGAGVFVVLDRRRARLLPAE